MTNVSHLPSNLRHLLRAPRIALRRSLREFAEQDIVIPDGPYKGRRFDCRRQPFTGLWFDAVDSGKWRRYVALGPTQSGKTLCAWVIPILYHLFEVGETVICGIPTIDMAQDKWQEDLLPAIEASRKFKKLLPTSGEGSRGGMVKRAVKFRNGATLRFMSGGGGDEKRSGFTSRVVVITEADKLDEAGNQSREADKITQMEARTDAWGDNARIYLECTVSVETGRIWREYQQGTCSKIVRPCPHCRDMVTLERDNLVAWEDSETELAAKRSASWACPSCGEFWSDAEREHANSKSTLMHGENGNEPDTDTFSIRWTAADNHFWKAGDIGAREWKARNDPDEENAEKGLRQFVWALPYIPNSEDLTALDPQSITQRTTNVPRGIVPAGTSHLTVGIDIGKWRIHWLALAWRPGATPHVVDYGILDVPSRELGVERAILVTLREFRDTVTDPGWSTIDHHRIVPSQVWVDSGYQPDSVYSFCAESGETYQPIKGLGASQDMERRYNKPKTTGSIVVKIGDGWHIAKLKSPRIRLIEIDADRWKTWLAERLRTPLGTTGAMTLYDARAVDHLALARHWTSEKQIEEFEPGKGLTIKWDKIRKDNHWLDCAYIACTAGNYAGVQLVTPTAPKIAPRELKPEPSPALVMPDGRPFLITER